MVDRPVVMVVEDDEEMNQLQRELLGLYGLDAVAAYTGIQALEVSARCPTDAVLLDVMLPEMDGFETCKRLRLRQGVRLPIVMVTALDSEDCRRQGLEAGADAYFAKPFDPDEVVQTLRNLIDRSTEK
ncbi:MAG: response regulator [Planctomycetaceae bacterium]|nr:response regulator [Planctomycetaceae bacterium]